MYNYIYVIHIQIKRGVIYYIMERTQKRFEMTINGKRYVEIGSVVYEKKLIRDEDVETVKRKKKKKFRWVPTEINLFL